VSLTTSENTRLGKWVGRKPKASIQSKEEKKTSSDALPYSGIGKLKFQKKNGTAQGHLGRPLTGICHYRQTTGTAMFLELQRKRT
jgi:hypothetical protein